MNAYANKIAFARDTLRAAADAAEIPGVIVGGDHVAALLRELLRSTESDNWRVTDDVSVAIQFPIEDLTEAVDKRLNELIELDE